MSSKKITTKTLRLSSLFIITTALSACGTISTETTEIPFDIASTSGDIASTASGSTGGDDSSSLAARAYLESDLAWIKRDAANGQGEHLQALAILVGAADDPNFGSWMKQHYAQIFSGNSTADDVYAKIMSLRSAA